MGRAAKWQSTKALSKALIPAPQFELLWPVPEVMRPVITPCAMPFWD